MSKSQTVRRLITLPKEIDDKIREKIKTDRTFNFSGIVQKTVKKLFEEEKK